MSVNFKMLLSIKSWCVAAWFPAWFIILIALFWSLITGLIFFSTHKFIHPSFSTIWHEPLQVKRTKFSDTLIEKKKIFIFVKYIFWFRCIIPNNLVSQTLSISLAFKYNFTSDFALPQPNINLFLFSFKDIRFALISFSILSISETEI